MLNKWQTLSEYAAILKTGADIFNDKQTDCPHAAVENRKLVELQLPAQDLALAHCNHVSGRESRAFKEFVISRNHTALDIGIIAPLHENKVCFQCGEELCMGESVVIAPRIPNAKWHVQCFVCVACSKPLSELIYCSYNSRVYCERHYAERLLPRCSACDELIFSGEYTRAMDQDWHNTHFSCWQCDETLTGQRYVLRDEHPYCIKCYENLFSNTCDKCRKMIGIDSKDLSYKEKHWHEACFCCHKCGDSLVDKQFGSKAEHVYCGPCYDAQYASRCDACGQVFRAGTKKMEYKTRQWHDKCFACCVCQTQIGSNSFIPREQEIYCVGCYENKFATRCTKCDKAITKGGVTYKDQPWHRECFTCTNCDCSLPGQRFTSRDDKPYCSECFGELFAKRCTSCSRPITGIGGARFISFEDNHWHNDCFVCSMCNISLAGKGFIKDNDDILCPDCAKERLM